MVRSGHVISAILASTATDRRRTVVDASIVARSLLPIVVGLLFIVVLNAFAAAAFRRR